MDDLDFALLFFQRASRFEVMNYVYTDLYNGFGQLGFKIPVIEVKDPQLNAENSVPDFPVRQIEADEFQDLLKGDNRLITDDNFSIIRLLSGIDANLSHLTIWVNYFYGHRFIFRQYRDMPYGLGYRERLRHLGMNFMPPSLTSRITKWYVNTLARSQTIAQSIWTSLLLSRVYKLKCSGVVYMPVDPLYYEFPLDHERELKCLIFFGNNYDTDLNILYETIKLAKTIVSDLEFEAFGNSGQAILFEKTTNIHVKFHNAIERKRLSELYNRSLFTICPIYNGNFERVPIESLLTGTPVISYIQPFLEVTGETSLIANIQNPGEVRRKILGWINGELSIERYSLKKNILSVMEYRKVARNFMQHMADIKQE